MKQPISMVIPTCNRQKSLMSTLQGALLQTYPPAEIIVVDSSTEPIGADAIANAFPQFPIRYFTSKPSVCVQRNFGVKMAECPWILLCDDDVEMPADYLMKLANYLSENEDAGIVTGLWLQKNKDGLWQYQYRTTSAIKCFWTFIFQLSCWGDFELIKTNFLTKALLGRIKIWYKKRGNGYSLAGWPLLTSFSSPVTRTAVYTLGAALIKREWLLASPFEEKLVPNGIGDNYGVTLNLPHAKPIHLLPGAQVWHHHAPENRLKTITAYRFRIYALHYFMKNSSCFNRWNRLFLYWSLVGNLLGQTFTLQLKMAGTTLSSMWILCSGKNPYLGKK